VEFTRPADRWIVLDGLHRLAKAAYLGHSEIVAHEVPADVYSLFAVKPEVGLEPTAARLQVECSTS
jgi:hypothetical protein